MRISDWSSDVCSSDLGAAAHLRSRPKMRSGGLRGIGEKLAGEQHVDGRAIGGQRQPQRLVIVPAVIHELAIADQQIGRTSCRERVCQYVEISVVAVSVKKKKK